MTDNERELLLLLAEEIRDKDGAIRVYSEQVRFDAGLGGYDHFGPQKDN